MRPNPLTNWSANDWLILLARWPQRGVGKSRLAASIGREQAFRLEHAFLLDTIAWSSAAPQLLIAFTPATAVEAFHQVAPRARLRRQAEGDLGHRIHQAFADTFAMGARRAVIIGSDSPNLPPAILDACAQGLTDADGVVSPAADGGFCALGLRRPLAELLAGIHWSTPTVLTEVVANAQIHGLRLRMAPPWYDVDDLSALGRLHTELLQDGELTPQTVKALAHFNAVKGGTHGS